MRLVCFTHSLASCWNHGNAHFLRGVLRELILAGHEVTAFEPAGGWSLGNLLRDHGEAGLDAWRAAYPELTAAFYDRGIDLDAAIGAADVVLVHEWNDPWLIAAIGRKRRDGGRFLALFHDTHHRAVSDPGAMQALALDGYDGILAFGRTLADVWAGWGWGDRAFVWHEAADTRLFHPPERDGERRGLVWIGNWGDGERSTELETFLLRPAARALLPLDIYGVRYPDEALVLLAEYGAVWRGWLANARVPEIFARALATVHVPRRFYARTLPGIPTIRVFEALACGVPLVSAPWEDSEGLFRAGEDYLVARDEAEMTAHLTTLRDDPALRRTLVASGLATIAGRHTCAHRAAELLAIATRLGAPAPLETTE